MNRFLILCLATIVGQSAFAATLTCYNARSTKTYVMMRTNFQPNGQLEDIQFAKFLKTPETGLLDYATIAGKLNTNTRSPYKGLMEYQFPNHDRLLLPANLSQQALLQLLETGIGDGPGENGVIIGHSKNWNEGSGNHYSFRLRCVSDQL